MSTPADTAIALMGRLSPLRFWKTLHDLAVTSMVGFSESQFAQLRTEMQNTAFRDEPWMPHVEAVVGEAARVRRRVC
jgi:hypothetical protein